MPSSSAKVHQDRQIPPVRPGPQPVRRQDWLKRWIGCLLCAAATAVGTFAGSEIFYPVRVPAAMQGKWLVVEGKDLNGAVLEFFADGRMSGNVPSAGKEVTISGRVEVSGNRFRVTTAGPAGGVTATEAEEILDLTERRFVVQDAHGEVLIMERPAAAGGVR